ncbi:uncharacterized protein RAG0_01361 [Rhynchosporium agropyri]|uniref:Uncharacterized protein n=1 Tax=Rhynchosporium agropyri TaxID=914238 RepID=A0A1E1JWX7_9HELO|nr:uncharacterized protein RAG0_01361 [Rhynchosporium agropyri]
MASAPDLPPGTIPDEPQYTTEQLSRIHAAMMEELGLDRVANLHLADRGAPIESLQPLKQPKKKMKSEIAAWHTLHLDEGADPTKAPALDNIADGQLYRLRRGGLSSGHRGNDTPRGGHFSNGNRGGGRENRGGAAGHGGRSDHHGQSGRQFMGPGHQDDRSYASRTPGTFFNDARLSIHGSRHIDQVYDRLRGTISSVNVSLQHNSGQGPRNPLLDKRPKGKTHVQPPKAMHPQSSKFGKLADSDAFLGWAKFGGPSNPRPQPKPQPTVRLPPVAGVVSHPFQPICPSISVPSTPVVTDSGLVVHPPSSLGSQGLSGSRWGPSPQQPVQSPAAPTPHQPLPNPSASLAPHDPPFICRNNVKFKMDNALSEMEGLATLRKNSNADELYTLELVSTSTNNMLVNETVSYDAVFELEGYIVTYRAIQRATQMPPTWKIRFQLPLHATIFAAYVIQNRLNAGHVDRPVSNMEHPLSNYFLGSQTPSSSAPETVVMFTNRNQETGHVDAQNKEPNNISQDQYHPGFELGNTSDLAVFRQDSIDEDSETLITLGNDVDTYTLPTTIDSKIFELLDEVDQINLTENLFEKLGGDLEFFNMLTREMVRRGSIQAEDVSLDEVISDPAYILAVCDAVELFLSRSEAFSMLSNAYSKALVQHQGPKVLTFALSRRGLNFGPSFAVTENNDVFDSTLIEGKASLVPSTADSGRKAEISSQVQEVAEDSSSPDLEVQNDTRIKYSPDDLLGLRDHAVAIEISEQPPRDRRSSTVRNAVTPIKIAPPVTTTDGWQNFSISHSSSETPAPIITAPAALGAPLDGLQTSTHAPAYATNTPLNPVTVRSLALATNSWQLNAANKQLRPAPVTPKVPDSRVTAKVEPHPAPKNAWEAYAAAEESQASPQGLDTVDNTRNTPTEVTKPKLEVNSDFNPSVSPLSVAPVALSKRASSQKDQMTDNSGWAALLDITGTSKPVIKSESQVSKGNLRHHPSKSDINERLAKSFSDWSLSDRYTAAEPTTPTVELSLAAPQTDFTFQSSPAPSVSSRREAPPRSSTAAFTPAGQAMKEKITAALTSKQSLVASPFQSPRSSFARQSAVGSLLESSNPELKVLPTQVKQEQSAPSPITVKAEIDLNSSHARGITTTSTFVTIEKLKAASTSKMMQPKALVQDYRNVEFGGPLPAIVQSSSVSHKVPPKPSAEHRGFEFSSTLPPVAQISKPNFASGESVTQVLKSSAGLSASRWADAPEAPHFSGIGRHPPSPIQPAHRAGSFYPQGHQVVTPGFAPRRQTVLVEHSDGIFTSVTGLVMDGSVPIPLVPHDPNPQLGYQAYAENTRPSSGGHMSPTYHPAEFEFPQRPTTYHQHNSSFGSDSKINPVASSFHPSPQYTKMPALAEKRPALSPRRVNIQAQIQSRLNSSMTSPRNAYQGPEL